MSRVGRLRGGVGGRFVGRLERGIGGGRGRPGEVSWWFAIERWEKGIRF